MRPEKVVSTLLNADQGVVDLCGVRIFGGFAKQQAPLPLVVYAKQSAQRDLTLNPLDGIVVEAQIDVLCVAATYPALKQLGEAVRVALNYKRGTIAGVEVIEIRIADEGPDQYDPDLQEHAMVWTFTVVHVE